MSLSGGQTREPRDTRQEETTRREIDTIFRALTQQSMVVAQVIETQDVAGVITGTIVTPIEIPNPDVVVSAGGSPVVETPADDPINPTDADGPEPTPTGVPSTYPMTTTDEQRGLSADTSFCYISNGGSSLTIHGATIAWARATGGDFIGTTAAHYYFELWSVKRKAKLDNGVLRSTRYPIRAQGSAAFPGQWALKGEIGPYDQIYVKAFKVGSPAAVGARDWTLTIQVSERIPQK